jgi:hypothetical protein
LLLWDNALDSFLEEPRAEEELRLRHHFDALLEIREKWLTLIALFRSMVRAVSL